MLKATWKYLGSLRCTLWLLVAMIGVFCIGFFLPQRAVVGKAAYLKWQAASPVLAQIDQALQLTEVFTAPITLALWGLFFLNLLLVMKQRIPQVAARIKVDPEQGARRVGSGAFSYRLELTAEVEARVPARLAEAGYLVQGTPDLLYAVKNRLSPLATLLFHLSFFLLLVGWGLTFYSRFAGFIDLSEHEPFMGEVARYNASPKLPKVGGPPDLQFLVESVVPEVSQGVATNMKIAITDDAGKRHEIGINRPYKTGYASVLFNDLGISPLFVVEDPSGRELDGAYVKLDVLKGKRDHFKMMGYEVLSWYFPDHVLIDGKDATRSDEFKNPAFHLEIARDGRLVASGTVHPGEAVSFDGVSLRFKEQSFWVRLLVTKEYGREFIFAGFLLALVALIWRLVYYRRELTAVVEAEGEKRVLKVAARADFYQALARDEFDRLVASITGN